MRSYQSVIILKPDFDEAQVDEALETICSFIKNQGGVSLKIDKWGKKRLAYKVRKNRFGYYLNIYHTCENDKVSVLEEKYRLFDPIIKYLVVRVEDKELERVIGEDTNDTTEPETESAGEEIESTKPSEVEKES
ncbi:MAG: 30S ribosomal protein S6 [Nitrospinaceae bacterium]